MNNDVGNKVDQPVDGSGLENLDVSLKDREHLCVWLLIVNLSGHHE